MSLRDWAKELSLESIGKVFYNLSYEEIFEHELRNGEVTVTKSGAVSVDTGKFTGRSPKDKYFVKADPSQKYIAWGKVNQPTTKEAFDELFALARKQLAGKNLYVFDGYTGANTKTRKKVRFVSELAWQHHFVTNMFIRPEKKELEGYIPDFTLFNACKAVDGDPQKHGHNSEVFVIFNIEENIAIIGGTYYGGEMKKGIFTMMNYWLPLQGILSMHCSANVGKNGDTALFFGLSGTGKTTLSTDPDRKLIGDDEHGWDDDGIFNFEGGCYAKTIHLDPKSEPEIYAAIRRDALLENVVVRADKTVDYDSDAKTENTRVSYPIFHIQNYEKSLKGGHPNNIIFLSYDAFGILPPVAKLTKEQAMYYFLSGYTAKVAGTERGVTEPTATFSACFGEVFMTLHPTEYAKLLGKKIDAHRANVYLVNTGLSGGAYGTGKRMSIKTTRGCINAILNGAIEKSGFREMPIFGILVPETLEGVDSAILDPKSTWSDKAAYEATARKLASLFIENFKRYQGGGNEFDFTKAGPQL
ncbi:MAG: phosphoenolpyruvate carboxykinase (ATP) [Helicobacteraceae bacterium]|jgi:phosphoenolpyruvate carboxykinase (ATP)|nr:phosphoenolpyruvate carboxykinase (ATP) [Helicobacteraceae bacterium]